MTATTATARRDGGMRQAVRDGLITARAVPQFRRWTRPMVFPGVRAIRRELARFRPELVVSVFPWMNLAAGIAVSRRWGRSPRHVIHLAGDPVPPDVAGTRRAPVYRRVFQAAVLRADAVVVLSNAMEAHLRSSYRLGDARIEVVPISAPVPEAPRQWNEGGPDGPVRFGVVSRLSAAKGVDLAISALAQLGPHAPATLDIFGDGPARAELEHLAGSLGVHRQVRFHGWIDDPAGVFPKLDCLLLPSYSEGTPRSILEAAGTGVPAIASRVGGVPDIVAHGETGWLVPPGQAPALADAMRRVVQEPGLLRAAGLAARRRAESRISADREILRVLECA